MVDLSVTLAGVTLKNPGSLSGLLHQENQAVLVPITDGDGAAQVFSRREAGAQFFRDYRNYSGL